MQQNKTTGGRLPAGGIGNAQQPVFQQAGRAARIMAEKDVAAVARLGMASSDGDIKLQRGHSAKEELRQKLKSKPTSAEDNAKAANALKQQLLSNDDPKQDMADEEIKKSGTSLKRKVLEISADEVELC